MCIDTQTWGKDRQTGSYNDKQTWTILSYVSSDDQHLQKLFKCILSQSLKLNLFILITLKPP